MIKTNNTIDPHKNIYSGCGLAIHRTGQFTSSDKNLARNVIIFRADLSNSRHATNRTQNILALGLGFIKNKIKKNTTIYAEKTYSPNFSVENKTFCLSLHDNGDNSYLFVNSKKFTQFKAKDSEIKANPLALGNISGFPNPMSETSKTVNSMEMFITLVIIVLLQMIKY